MRGWRSKKHLTRSMAGNNCGFYRYWYESVPCSSCDYWGARATLKFYNGSWRNASLIKLLSKQSKLWFIVFYKNRCGGWAGLRLAWLAWGAVSGVREAARSVYVDRWLNRKSLIEESLTRSTPWGSADNRESVGIPKLLRWSGEPGLAWLGWKVWWKKLSHARRIMMMAVVNDGGAQNSNEMII